MDDKRQPPAAEPAGNDQAKFDDYDCPETPPTQTDAYMDAVTPDYVKAAIARRKSAGAKLAAE